MRLNVAGEEVESAAERKQKGGVVVGGMKRAKCRD